MTDTSNGLSDILAAVATVVGIAAALSAVVVSLSALTERSRRQKEIERWVFTLPYVESPASRVVAERMIQNDVARLIAIRQFPNTRVVFYVLLMIGMFVSVGASAFEQTRLYFELVVEPHEIALLRVMSTEYWFLSSTGVLVGGYVSMFLYEHRRTRLRLYIESGGSTGIGHQSLRSPERIFSLSMGASLGVFVLLWEVANIQHEILQDGPHVADLIVFNASGVLLVLCASFLVVDHRTITRARHELFTTVADGSGEHEARSNEDAERDNRRNLLAARSESSQYRVGRK